MSSLPLVNVVHRKLQESALELARPGVELVDLEACLYFYETLYGG